MLNRRALLGAGAALPLLSAVPAWPAGADQQPDAVVDAFVRDAGFQGVVMLGRMGKPDYIRTVGYADIEARLPAKADTPYAIASISKWLTTVTVLKLVERGLLDLDAPLTRFLPDYRADTGAKLTLRRLLCNASGLPNLFSAAGKEDPTLLTTDLTTGQALTRFCQGDLMFEPGDKFDYNMVNWIVVVAVVERVTGLPFQAAVRSITLDPLGMKATAATDKALETVAPSYRTVEPPDRWRNDRRPYLAAAGGYASTAPDLMRGAHLVFDTGFLTPESRRQLTHVEMPTADYALGGRVRQLTIQGRTVLAGWETGRTAGYRLVLGHRLDGRRTVVILNNTALSQKTMDQFADRLLGAEPRP
ncbi:serine hydrolase domain-containing protein [Nitrospirillum iridis]|uniref:CubicO group peptidase (Beta-lactamase class C family) n=1 Tax=Nitrospirillum iridis TaxID=765888 RepID=A0A7X0B380_9PROT|nr:serine hydrolase domain-containing protein [Nitrospirillum iridis]MBB6254914.1 CubicO group peptidase (beta-lactamase class C family) [Nitrospirillum iridis]